MPADCKDSCMQPAAWFLSAAGINQKPQSSTNACRGCGAGKETPPCSSADSRLPTACPVRAAQVAPNESGCFAADGDGDLDPQPAWLPSESEPGVIRPGIVHRLDKGTTGLLVAAKDARTLAALAEQFKAHTVRRSSCAGPLHIVR